MKGAGEFDDETLGDDEYRGQCGTNENNQQGAQRYLYFFCIFFLGIQISAHILPFAVVFHNRAKCCGPRSCFPIALSNGEAGKECPQSKLATTAGADRIAGLNLPATSSCTAPAYNYLGTSVIQNCTAISLHQHKAYLLSA